MNDAFGRPQNVLVVGATSDIAQAVIERLKPTLQQIVLAGRDVEALQTVGSTLGPSVAYKSLHFDALEFDEHDAFVHDAVQWLGDIDLAVVAHGALGETYSLDLAASDVAQIIQINHTGAATISHSIGRQLRDQGHGTIAILSSVAAVRPRVTNLAYASAKAGLDGFARGLDHALVGSGARVMLVRPGFVHSKMTHGLPEQPMACSPNEVADAMINGLTKKRSVVSVPKLLGPASAALRNLPTPIWRKISDR